LANIEERMGNVGIHPDIAGFADLSHAFDLRSSVLAARATIECALERRETRGCHNRSDDPEQDPARQVTLVWSPSAGRVRESIPPIDPEVEALMRTDEIRQEGKLVE